MNPSTDNYQLGKGVAYFDRLDSTTGLYTGERDLGNAPSFAFNISLEKLQHFSSRGGLKAKDKDIISQITPGITFTLDEISEENIAILTLGTLATVSQVGDTVTAEPHIAHPGKRIALAYRGISAVTVTNVTDAGVLVAGTDYVIDTTLKDDKIGRIYIMPDSDSVTEGDALTVAYTYATTSYQVVKAFKETQVEGRIRFVSDNPAGNQQELEIWRVSVSPAGDTSMIGDDWSTLGFVGEVLKDETGHPDSPYMNFIFA